MESEYEVLWSKESKLQFNKIILYLRNQWTEKEVETFIAQLKGFEQIVMRFPKIYAESKEKAGYRRAVLSKHNSVIYKVDWEKAVIRVYTIFDNRQHPGKLK